MSWTGRIIGLILGFLILRFPGAIIGFLIGYFAYDRPKNTKIKAAHSASQAFSGANISPQAHARLISSLFSMMGYVARGAGAINTSHINAAEQVISIMRLDEAKRDEAINAFNYGKSPDFNLQAEINDLRSMFGNNPYIFSYVLEILVNVALADDKLDEGEHERLLLLASAMGVDQNQMERFIRIRFAEKQFANFSNRFREYRQRSYERRYGSGDYNSYGNRSYESYNQHADDDDQDDDQEYQNSAQSASQSDLDNAYAILGVTKDASWEDIKKAHRKLMLKYHPDRLASQGLPPEMIKLYTQKAQDIQAAFTLIKASRKK